MRVFAIVLITVLASGSIAQAKCGSGNPPSYDDIEAVMFVQHGGRCWTDASWKAHIPRKGYAPAITDDFNCSSFWAFLWTYQPGFGSYSQYDLKDQVGSFKLDLKLSDSVAILRKDNFFDLSPPDRVITDTVDSVLSVKRCGLVTKIVRMNVFDHYDQPSLQLFDDLRNLFMASKKTRISTKPSEFEETLLFDPN